MKMRKRWSTSVITKWALSYLLVFLIPISMSVLLLYQINNFLENKISAANQQLLVQIKSTMDDELTNISGTVMDISVNGKVNTVARNSGALTARSNYLLLELINEYLPVISAGNDMIGALYIYCNDGQFSLTSSAKYNSKLTFETFYGSTSLTFDAWKKLMSQNHNFNTIVLEPKTPSMKKIRSTSIVQSITFQGKEAKAEIVVVLNEKKVAEMLESVQLLNKGFLTVQDSQGRVIYSNMQEDAQAELFMENLKADNSNNVYLEGNRHIVMKTESERWGWTYTSAIPESVFWNEIHPLNTSIVLSLFACLLAGSIAMIVLLRKNYLPLNELVKKLRESKTSGEAANEYQLIDTSVSRIMLEKQEIFKKLEHQREMAVSGFISSLLKGKAKDKDKTEETALSLGLAPWHRHFVVLSFGNCKSKQNAYLDDAQKAQEQELVSEIAYVFESIDTASCYLTDIAGHLTAVVNFDCHEERPLESETEALIKHITGCMEKVNQQRIIAISSVLSNANELNVAYSQASEAIEYRIIMLGEQLIWFDNLPKEETRRYQYNFEMERQLMRSIKQNSRAEAEFIVDSVLTGDSILPDMPLSMVKCLSFDLVSTFIKAVRDFCRNADEAVIEYIIPIDEILAFESLEELKQKLLLVFERLTEHLCEQKKGKSDALVQRCEQYIVQNYSNNNLNIGMLAEALGINANYASKLFKAKTGTSLLDYINSMRIEKANELLKTTNYSSNEISAMVGYYNNIAMIRAFKRHEGITPGEWRKQNSQQ